MVVGQIGPHGPLVPNLAILDCVQEIGPVSIPSPLSMADLASEMKIWLELVPPILAQVRSYFTLIYLIICNEFKLWNSQLMELGPRGPNGPHVQPHVEQVTKSEREIVLILSPNMEGSIARVLRMRLWFAPQNPVQVNCSLIDDIEQFKIRIRC